jgi:hypothetical protein
MVKEHKEMTVKNTKEQILSAYAEALEQLKNKPITPIEEKNINNKIKQVEEVKHYGYDGVKNQLEDIGKDFSSSLEILATSISKEYEKFLQLQQTIEFEQQHLNELYQIKESANTLSALIIANQKQAQQFEIDMSIKESEWSEKLSELETTYKQKKQELEKQSKREEEEYQYSIMIQRREELDQYEQQKLLQSRQLLEQQRDIEIREKNITEKEQEFLELKSKVANNEQEIQAKIQIAVDNNTKELQQSFDFTQTLKDEQSKSNLELAHQKIETLQQKIQEQQEVIKQLNLNLKLAQEQTQQIAHKALETSIRNVVVSTNDNKNNN